MNRNAQRQKVFKENCGEDENFIGILAPKYFLYGNCFTQTNSYRDK